jgi:hypothetical protein
VLREWTNDHEEEYRPNVGRVYWPFDRTPGPGLNSQNQILPTTEGYGQQLNTFSPSRTYSSRNFQELEADSPYPITIPRPGYQVQQPILRRPRPQVITDTELTNIPDPIGIPLNNLGPPPYTHFNSRRSRIYRPNYFDPRGINYAPRFNNYIPITRFYHDMKPELGEYNVGFETGNGIVQQESGYVKSVPVFNTRSGRYEGGSANVKQGSVSWTSPEGIPFSFSYTADENGFRAIGDHIPPGTGGTQQATVPTSGYNPIQKSYK